MLETQNSVYGNESWPPRLALKALSCLPLLIPCSPDAVQSALGLQCFFFWKVPPWIITQSFLSCPPDLDLNGPHLSFPCFCFTSVTLCHITHFIPVWNYPACLFVTHIASDSLSLTKGLSSPRVRTFVCSVHSCVFRVYWHVVGVQ